MPTETEDSSAPVDDTVVFFQGPLIEAKQLRDACVEADIPAALERGACCGSGGCGCAPKLQVLVSREDLPRTARLAAERWRALAVREGTLGDDHPLVTMNGDGAACPACGNADPVVEGACAGCGLQLE